MMRWSSVAWLFAGIAGAGAGAMFVHRPAPPARPPVHVQAPAEPQKVVVRTGLGGTVKAVPVRVGTPAAKGALLVEFTVPAAAEAAGAIRKAVAGIPRGALGGAVDRHASVLAAEAEYVAALEAGDPRPIGRAAEKRQTVRRQVSLLLEQFPAQAADLAALADRTREQAAVRAPENGIVEMVAFQPGERVLPGQAVAVLALPDAYAAEIVLPAAYPLKPGARLQGTAGGRTVTVTVADVKERRIPFSFRQERDAAIERTAHVRWQSAEALTPGTPVTILLP